MAQFADYGFNRSHSVAYAYLAYQTAYLKAHYSTYFYAAVLSNEAQDTTKVYKYANELRSSGLKLLPPDINESDADFTPLENAVRFGLSAIKGIGTASVESIIGARKNEKFTSLYDFTSRLDQGSVNRRGLESLITAGSFDSLMPPDMLANQWRANHFAAIEGSLSHGQKVWQDKIRGQSALFGIQEAASSNLQALPAVKAWSQSELSKQEKAAVGFYLSTHPLDEYRQVLEDLRIINIADYEDLKPGDKITIAGIVSGLQIRHSKKGNRFCIFRLEDQSTGVKCLAWAEAAAKYAECLKDDELLIVHGKVESTEGQEITLILEETKKLADAITNKAQNVSITLPFRKVDEKYLEDIFTVLDKHKGNCQVYLNLRLDQEILIKVYAQPLRIQGSSRLESDLKNRGCEIAWGL